VPSWNAGVLAFTAFSNGAYLKSTATGVSTQAVPIGVADGGTGATTLTIHGLLLGQAAGAITAKAAMAKGSLIVGQTGADPTELVVGTDAFILTADSTAGAGIKWAAAGGATGVVVKDTVTATTTVTNTITETTIYTSSRTNELGTTGAYRLTILGTIKDTTADTVQRTMTIRLKLGASTIATLALITTEVNGACPIVGQSIGGPVGYSIVAEIANLGATNSQFGLVSYQGLQVILVPAAATSVTAKTKDVTASGTSAVDTTAAQAVAVSVQWSNANANRTLTLNSAKLELM
jgi:hypothetical protein